MRQLSILLVFLIPALAHGHPPVASYIFPAGAQRGTKVNVKVGGLFLHDKCGFAMFGPGVTAPAHLTRTKTTWFEGPLLPLPDSQRQEDYPKDMAGLITVASDGPLGVRYWRVWTSQGATGTMKFFVGDLPEIVENEIDGDPVAVPIALPVTINGRIFPREDIDVYSFSAKKGQSVRCEVYATRLGSPLDARLEVRDGQGRRVAEADAPTGGDAVLRFVAPADGEYQVRIQDALNLGGQAYVYRLTVSSEPFVERVFPLGGRRGKAIELKVDGLMAPRIMWMAIPPDAPAEYRFSDHPRHPASNVILDVDDLPESTDAKATHSLPVIVNGRIENPGQMDEWKCLAKKGESWDVELRAARFGSKLDGVLAILDKEGKILAKADANPADPSLRFTAPADGEYRVQVQDRFRSRGGPEFAYRLRIAPPAVPDFRLTLVGDPRQATSADAVSLPRKGQAKLKLNVERIGGFKEPITLEVQGLPSGVSVTPTLIQANQASVDLLFKADETAKVDIANLAIVGKVKDMHRFARIAVSRGMPGQSGVLLAVAMPTPFVIKGEYDMGFAPRGGMHKRKYKIERNGFDGPIEISLADRQARHLQGVEGPTIKVPAGASEFTYAAYLPPWMETGRTCRVCVQGVGVIKDKDGTEHRVVFSSVNQNEQLVAVVGPGMLAMEAERSSYRAEPGKQFTVAVKVQRGQGIAGPVELQLVTAGQGGLSAAKTAIDAKSDRGQLVVTCGDRLAGPFNMPVVVRATLMRDGEPMVAEVKLDVQP